MSVRVAGVWEAQQRLVALPIDDQGAALTPITAPRTPEGRRYLLDCLVTVGIDTLVVTDRNDQIIACAHHVRLRVYTAPHALVNAVRDAAGLKERPLRHSAAMLARFALNPMLRPYLRQTFPPQPQRQQLALF